MELGLDTFITEPGAEEEMHCRICSAKCDVRRNVNGPIGFAMAVAKKKKLHDLFTCPNAQKEWHIQAGKLIEAIEDMPSERVADLMRQDLEELLAEQAADSEK